MIRFILILLLIPSKVISQNRLPSYPSTQESVIKYPDLSYPKVKKVVCIDFSFINDSMTYKKKIEYTYSQNKISMIKYFDSKSDSVFAILRFDKYFRIINQDRLDKYFMKSTYSYDDNNFKSTETQFYKNLTIFQKTEIYYNKNYQPIKKIEYNGDSVLSCYWTYKYNNLGDLIEQIFINTPNGQGIILDSSITGNTDRFFASPNDTTRFSIFYDSLKRPIIKTEYHNSIKKKRIEFKYFQDSSYIKTTKYLGFGSGPSEFEFEIKHDSIKILKNQFLNWDDSTKINSEYISVYVNNVLKNASVPKTYTVTDYKYRTDLQYDSHKNWIKKTFFENGRINRIIERKITY